HHFLHTEINAKRPSHSRGHFALFDLWHFMAGRPPAINCQTSNKAKGPIERLGLFAFISLWKKLSDNDADAF
ncbi:hypothetical protein, partial [Salmonella enterica]|uniref:hypothetical protein n=1 Tax=Salmonella enterica TaxID=28901 RepID=UPI001F249F79